MCPRTASPEYNLLALNPALAAEWHSEKNGNLYPANVTPGSEKKVWWKCGKGHEWQARIDRRSSGTGCPMCARKVVFAENCLATLYPELAKEWHPKKNGRLTPYDISPHSKRKVWWKCKNNHVWLKRVDRRSIGRGCPHCSVKPLTNQYCLTALNPYVAIEWHPVKNGALTPWDFKPQSSKKVWWRCRWGHEWMARIDNRYLGASCPVCAGKVATPRYCLQNRNPVLAAEWHPEKNGTLSPWDVTPGSAKRVWWRCRWGHEWSARIYKRNSGKGCPICRKLSITRSRRAPRPTFK